jgi:hypothetical protein
MKKIIGVPTAALLSACITFYSVLGYKAYNQYKAEQDPDTLYLCHMFDKVNLGSIIHCRVHTMPDGTRAIIENNNKTTPYLLDLFNRIENNPQRITPTERIDETNPYIFTA